MSSPYDRLFLHGSEDSQEEYRQAMNRAMDVLIRDFASAPGPYSGADPQSLLRVYREVPVCPEDGAPIDALIERIGTTVVRHSAVVTDPACIAHLHCPPLSVSLAAEALVSGTNQSMDSWDQSMSGTLLEERITAWLCGIFGYDPGSDGVFTSGGTQSNFMGLLLARNHFAKRQWGWDIQRKGLPPEASRMRILCSEAAHFTVKQSAALLGLGEQTVVTVPVDSRHRMRADAAAEILASLTAEGLLPFALVATAGTTDFGSIDPLRELAGLARTYGLWLHADAAYGGALVLSDTYAVRLRGLELADSITVDFHKMFYQPISCGAFLLKERRYFDYIRLNADYLNPEEDEDHGIPNLVTKSVQTTRRFDALKLYMSLQHLGRRAFGEMIDFTVETARATARFIRQDPQLELIGEPEMNAVVFRYVPPAVPGETEEEAGLRADLLHTEIRAQLLAEGRAVVARTRVKGRVCLKFTLLNPRTTAEHTAGILQEVKRIGGMLGRTAARSQAAKKGTESLTIDTSNGAKKKARAI
ncbi:L-2,4-diaminobutyrate decarboxylase [Paenibacillus mucilaginosus 3016]|uniref:L-2,4-diaminobutyrate decarboxylase n=2 Tax=Paenibacillus mucilaginosus TaxID=61624 RepID=H6NMA2_9BACL|nr:aspartate aminotransferase family protein [Paenibacillus mucilaginosus]AFC33264.1 L-2,4-diaminobutyrate decarboxylase [Paenibacillus mucilaginosus 3016]AFH65578.1 2,4-diaminobutyrate decarboxylase [Paenibacillus mucilaginosus K02]